jgi:hypothetical protein
MLTETSSPTDMPGLAYGIPTRHGQIRTGRPTDWLPFVPWFPAQGVPFIVST